MASGAIYIYTSIIIGGVKIWQLNIIELDLSFYHLQV